MAKWRDDVVSFESTDKELKLVLKPCDMSANEMMVEMLRRHPKEVREFVSKTSKIAVEELDSYEGGIDCWWGLGSVALCILGMEVNLKMTCDEFTLTVS